MKIIDIITSDMHQLHGANKVTEKLIMGQKYFKENGFYLRYVFSQDGIIECKDYKQSKLGVHLSTSKYKRKRKIINTLKKIPIYQSVFVQKIIVNKEIYANNRICKYFDSVKIKPDIIIFQDPYAAICFMGKIPNRNKTVFISHADTDPLEHLLMGRPCIQGTTVEKNIRIKFDALFKWVNHVVTICKSSKEYMKNVYGLDCSCIINGIEDIKVDIKKKYSELDNNIHIAIVASIQRRKGQEIAVRALADVSEQERKKIKLHIFGDGDEFENLKLLIEKSNLKKNVILYGAILDVEKYLPLMDVFMLPSRADTVPVAIIEAMRAGLPIFASNVGEIPDMIGGCGKLIEPTLESVRYLYMDLLKENYNLQELGNKSREKFLKEFQLSAMIDKYSIVLNKISNR